MTQGNISFFLYLLSLILSLNMCSTSETVSRASEKNVVVLKCLSGVSCRSLGPFDLWYHLIPVFLCLFPVCSMKLCIGVVSYHLVAINL